MPNINTIIATQPQFDSRLSTQLVSVTAVAGALKTWDFFTVFDSYLSAANFATFDTRNSVPLLDFDDTAIENALFIGYVPKGAFTLSGVNVNIYWNAATAVTGAVNWGCQIQRLSGVDLDNYGNARLVSTSTSTVSGVVSTSTVTITAVGSLSADMPYILRIYRNATDATYDTMLGDACFIAAGTSSPY